MYRKWKPSATAKRDFADTMSNIEAFCREHNISKSASSDSYYFTLNGVEYRVSNHSVESSKKEYHPNGREKGVRYIHASKTRIVDIYNNLFQGYDLDGRGNRKGM